MRIAKMHFDMVRAVI